MDELIRRMRMNIEAGERVEETWQAIGVLASAVQMEDWDFAFELVVGCNRKLFAKQYNDSKRASA
jgi:hypothetical protein